MTAFFVIVAISAVIVLTLFSLLKRASHKEMDKKMQASGADAMITALHIEGIGLQNKAACDLYLMEDKLLIDHFGQKFEIPLSRMRAAEVKTEQEIYEKGKSVVGRAIIGTLLVPGLGTIIGGMSGIGNKQVKSMPNTYLILNFVNSAGELSGVTFLNNFNIGRINQFCQSVNRHVITNQAEPVVL